MEKGVCIGKVALCDSSSCYHLFYLIKVLKSQWAALHNISIILFEYCYLSVNVITLDWSQSDTLKSTTVIL